MVPTDTRALPFAENRTIARTSMVNERWAGCQRVRENHARADLTPPTVSGPAGTNSYPASSRPPCAGTHHLKFATGNVRARRGSLALRHTLTGNDAKRAGNPR